MLKMLSAKSRPERKGVALHCAYCALTAAAVMMFSASFAHADGAARAKLTLQVVNLLRAYESNPKASDLRALGPDVPAVLRSLAQNTESKVGEIPAYVRARAAGALRFFPVQESLRVLRAVSKDAAKHMVVRRNAMMALAEAFPKQAPGDLGPMLAAPDSRVRMGAAMALAKIKTAPAQELLAHRVGYETHPGVTKVIADALRAK